jgi:hypothetical protein
VVVVVLLAFSVKLCNLQEAEYWRQRFCAIFAWASERLQAAPLTTPSWLDPQDISLFSCCALIFDIQKQSFAPAA